MDALPAHRPAQGSTAVFICDLQSRFQPAIHAFDQVANTARKMVKFAKLLSLPVLATEQNPRVLGATVDDIGLASLGDLHLGTHGKTLFSMITPEVESALSARTDIKHIVLLGIEAHICVLQTALDLLSRGYAVHVLADGVSSCNPQEVPIALASIRQAGARVTTSESLLFQLIHDAGRPEFKPFTQMIKEEKAATTATLQALL
ncbi:Isochorismatase hydrolase [Auricularia subglabra TFB-10046 SS5]|nr:Isochorismatase hydrolase [Auricularia subglabra TFB-10046 SS5]